VGTLEGLRLKWDRNDIAVRNIFRNRVPRLYLKSAVLMRNHEVERVLFDRDHESWLSFANERIEPNLGNAASLSTDIEPVVLFRIWCSGMNLDPDSGIPRTGEVQLEYVARIAS